MNIGKYYWVKTKGGFEIAYQRYIGKWEMHGIDITENVNDLILEVKEEIKPYKSN